MKKWPKDRKQLLDAESLLSPLIKLLKQVKKNPNKDYKFSGYELPSWIGVTSIEHDYYASKEGRDYEEERGRSIDESLLWAAFQLGCEQGYRKRESEGVYSWYCDKCQAEVYQDRCKHCGKNEKDKK